MFIFPFQERASKTKTLSVFDSFMWLMTWPLGSRKKCHLPLSLFFIVLFSLVEDDVLIFLFPSLYFCCCCGSQTFPNSRFGLGSDFLSDFPRGLCVYPSPTQLPGRPLRSESDSCVSTAGKLDDAPSRLHGKAHGVCSALFKDLYNLCLQIPFPALSPICEPLVLMKFDFPVHQPCASSVFCT